MEPLGKYLGTNPYDLGIDSKLGIIKIKKSSIKSTMNKAKG